jgi:Zn-dependent protease
MRLRIGSGFAIPVYVHWTFLLLPLLILGSGNDSEVPLPLLFTLLPLVFGCVLLHEFGHALMARRFGIETQDVTLYPIGGVARLLRMPDHPLQEFLVAVAGPAVNVAIATVLGCVAFALAVVDLSLFATFFGKLLVGLIGINVVLIAFNLLPAFPMDGGRVLRALLASCIGHYQATRIAVNIGSVMAVLIGVTGFVFLQSYMLPIVMLFIFFAGRQELAAVERRERRRLWEDENSVEVLPVHPAPLRHVDPAGTAAAFMFQPKISVYTWDNQTGTWRKDPS